MKDKNKIMSQATNKEVSFSSQQYFQLLRCLISPHKDLMHYDLELKLN